MVNSYESVLASLWANETLPICDGLYRADGAAWAAKLDSDRPGHLLLGESLYLESMLETDPENLTCVNYLIKLALADGAGYLFCGDGSWGGEGHFGMLDQNNSIVWVVYLEFGNPFIQATVDGSMASFESTSGILVTVDLTEGPYRPLT